jgi:hypothetical protein
MMLSLSETLRLKGVKSSLRTRGRAMIASNGETVTGIVHEEPTLPDVEHTAQAEKTIYASITTIAGTLNDPQFSSVKDPRAVTQFQEIGGKTYFVIRFEESSADRLTWKWFCEAQRENFTPAPSADATI